MPRAVALGLLAAAILLAGCASSRAVPETIALEAGTSVRHDVGEAPTQINTVNVKALWRLR